MSIIKKFKWSTEAFGCDRILRSELGLSEELPLPITIPHGIDCYQFKIAQDLHCHEPIYMAFRDDIAERVAKFKTILEFPHPWLLIISRHKMQRGSGTLFLAPPPSNRDFEAMLQIILKSNHPKPWGVLIKERNVRQGDFDWWRKRGFLVHTAGAVSNKQFFYNLRDIFAIYQCVASPNMSSAIIFAVAMNRRAFALPNVRIECVDVVDFEENLVLDDVSGKITDVWRDLLSDDLFRARSRAEDLLGMRYMDNADNLRDRLTKAIESVLNKPVHLFPAGNGRIYRVCIWLIGKHIPVQKLFPNPLSKIIDRLLGWIGFNKLTVVSGSDFSHYGVAGDLARLQIRKVFAFQLGRQVVPGYAAPDATRIQRNM